MRIDFSVDGGLATFPGLARPVTIDCDALPPPEGERLRDLVRRAGFFALPAHGKPARLPDARAYTIAIDDGVQCKKVTVCEPVADPALRALIADLADRAAALRSSR